MSDYINIAAAFLNKYCESINKEEINIENILEKNNDETNIEKNEIFITQFKTLKEIVLNKYIPNLANIDMNNYEDSINLLLKKIYTISLKEGYVLSKEDNKQILHLDENAIEYMFNDLMEDITQDHNFLLEQEEMLIKYLNLEEEYLKYIDNYDIEITQNNLNILEKQKYELAIELEGLVQKIDKYSREQKNG